MRLTFSSSVSRYSADVVNEAELVADAAAVEAVVAEVPIRPKFRAVGRATSDRNAVDDGAVLDEEPPEEEDSPSMIVIAR